MATPSLAMIPSGYKASKVYSVLPESGVGDFDFTRATTATRINSSGLIETVATNVPRLEYPLIDGVVNGCPSLKLEPQRTNVLLQSNQFDTTWTLSNASVVGNQSGIYNTTDAWKLVGNGSNNDRLNSNSLSSGAYTFSIYAKAGNSKFVAVVLGSAVVYYNLETGSVGSAANVTNSSIESVGNDWYRLTLSVASFNGSAQIYIANGVGDVNTSNGDFIYLQHSQAEVGTYATSIIPTSGSAVTRNAETCNGAGNAATFNDSEGVLMAEISSFKGDNTDRQISLSNGSTSNRIVIAPLANGTQIQFYVVSGGAVIVNQTKTIDTITDSTKMTFSYKLNDFKVYVNGFLILTDTSGAVPIGLNELAFDRGDGGEDYYGNTKQIQYYNSALTDSELEKLTSWTSFSDMANGQQYSII